jgi:predicted SAM-dependent methyltransferase
MESIKLHIGGKEPHPDWKILNVQPGEHVDFVGNASCLEKFTDSSIESIYASHLLEHFLYGYNNELLITLSEWYRVLKPGGKIYISVPDLRKLCWLFLNPDIDYSERYHLMRVIFGGQVDEYDVHKVGFDFDILAMYLAEVGFLECEQVEEFAIFQNDCSSIRFRDTLISLNVIATK